MSSTRQVHRGSLRKVRLNLVGFGNVGKALARLLVDKGQEFRVHHGVEFIVTAIATGRHGSIVEPDGIDLARVMKTLASGEMLQSRLSERGCSGTVSGIIRNAPGDIVVELTPLNPETGEPAISHVRAALDTGKHVVSANKGPIAFAYSDLSLLAARRGLQFLFESTVMDGAPVFNLARYCLRGSSVLGFKGILNSTTNFVIGEMEKGHKFNDSVIRAMKLGFAEADPSMDLEGWDAAVKTAVLSNVLLGADITPKDVERTGITQLTQFHIEKALKDGKRIKLACEAGFTKEHSDSCMPGHCDFGPEATLEGRICDFQQPIFPSPEPEAGSSGYSQKAFYARVMPVCVEAASTFGQIEGTTSCLVLRTGLMGDLTLIEHAPGLVQTAYGVLNDLLEIAACL